MADCGVIGTDASGLGRFLFSGKGVNRDLADLARNHRARLACFPSSTKVGSRERAIVSESVTFGVQLAEYVN
jgi:hypothetical protein